MSFPTAFLDDIRSRVPLASVIGRSVRLIRKGREYSGLCPFHNEKTPSFTVNEEKGFFHCFGCGAHGDVITFEMRIAHLSFPEAVEKLAQAAGMAMPVQAPEEREKERRAASLYDAVEAAAAFFESQLRAPAGREALDYLRRRGLDEETIGRFRLGFAPEGRTQLKQALKAIPEPLAVEAGLLIRPDGGGDSYDRFRGRVMFPITDRRGRVIAFGGRTLGDGQPKYLNSPDTPLFHKGRILYGLAQAREPAARAGTMIVCEGYMDVIALHRAGFANAVAPLGTALTEEQIELLWQTVPDPILCLDGDAAGQRAAERAADRALTILRPGRSLRFATLPAAEDPDSLIRTRGADAMRAVFAGAIPLVEMLWRAKFAAQPLATPEQRQGAEQAVRHHFAVIPDFGLRRDYVYEFVRRLREAARTGRVRTPAFAGGGAWKAAKPKARQFAQRDASGRVLVSLHPSPLPPPAWQTQERLLLMMVITHPPLLEDVAERLGELHFADSALDKLRQEVLMHLDGWASLDFEGVQRQLKSCGMSQTLDCLLEASAHDHSACLKPDAPIEVVREGWGHVYGLYRQKDVAAEVQQALQRTAAELTDETFGFFNALWSGQDRGGDL